MNREKCLTKIQELLHAVNRLNGGRVFKFLTPQEFTQVVHWTLLHSPEMQSIVAFVRNGQNIKLFKQLTLEDVQEAYDLVAVKEVIES